MSATILPPKRRKAVKTSAVPVQLSTDRRFVMVGNCVKILADYDFLKGHYARVISPDFGEGKVLVEMISGGQAKREICFLSHEIRHSPSGGGFRFSESGSEEMFLTGRAVEFAGHAVACKSGQVRATLLRRKERLLQISAAINREEGLRKVRAWATLGFNFCRAIVPYVPMEREVAA